VGTRIRVSRRPWPRARQPRWLHLVGTLVVGASLAGCGITVGPTGDDTAKLHDQAQAALARWAAAVAAAGGNDAFAQIGDRTLQIGDWEEAVGGDDKVAMLDGLVESTIPLSDETPPDGQVHWPDGTASTVGLVSAAQVLTDLKSEGDPSSCPGCKPLEITKAELSNGPVTTSRGTAQAPMWLFSLQGTAVRLARVAVASKITVTPPAWDPYNPPIGLAINAASGSLTGRQLTVSFTGAPGPASQSCGADYTAEAVESAEAVVVIVITHANLAIGACTAVGAPRTATVELAAPLGSRAVLEVQQGLPVTVSLNP
jgi:hypothetical protein